MVGKNFSSFLGEIYESAFKLGFLKDRIDDYDVFKKKQVFGRLKNKLQKFEDDDFQNEILNILNLLENNTPFDPTRPSNLNLTEFELKNSHRNIVSFVFLVGYYEGFFENLNFKSKNLELVKYDIGEESSIAGAYENADLIFIVDKTLYVIDFKLAGSLSNITEILSLNSGSIPYRTYGLPVNISVGELNFGSFVESILRIKDKLLEIKDASPELKGFLQILSYTVDYLCENKRNDLEEISLSLLYPFAEPYSARFYYDGQDLTPYREEVQKLYKEIKSKEKEYNQAENPSKGRLLRLEKELPQKIGELKTQMIQIEKEDIIKPDPIKSSREDVSKRLDEFLKKEDPVKVLCLLHSAGSGKTSQTRERILNLDGNHIVLYMATRKVLLNREYKILEEKQKNGYDIALVYEKKANETKKIIKNSGDTYQNQSNNAGILKRTVEEINKIRQENKRFIWAFTTQQAIVETFNTKTSDHLKALTSKPLLKNYTIHIILDELLGYQNGLYAIEELLKFLKTIKERGGKANLYIFDANGYTPRLFEKLFKEYKTFEVIPSAVILSDFENETVFQEEGINIYAYARHGYPSPEIRLKRKFIYINGNPKEADDEITEKIALYIKDTIKKDKSTAFMFVQYKEHIALLKEKLKEEGLSVLVATADSKKSQESINKGDEDIILATSAVSRGIDLSRPHKPVNQIFAVIYDWGIENNMVELIQAISRSRGDKETEKQPKEIHLVYIVNPLSDFILDKILEYMEEEKVDKRILKLLLEKQTLEQKLDLDYLVSGIIKQFVKSSEGKVLVPIPNQYKSRYIHNSLSDLQSVINFLDGISTIEDNNDIKTLLEKLISAVSISVVEISFDEKFEYYHPYILLERQKVRTAFDNKKRSQAYMIYKNLEDLLKKHNEDRVEEVKKVINTILPGSQDGLPVLVPIYSLVLVKHFLKPGEKVIFELKGRIGRGSADTLMGGTNPKTFCFKSNNDVDEYACILLTEDYPYKEILSGRFVKFPIEFLKAMMGG